VIRDLLTLEFPVAAHWIPVLAASGTLIGLYILPSEQGPQERLLTSGMALVVALVLGLVAAATTASRDTPARAHSRTYGFLRERIAALEAICKRLQEGCRTIDNCFALHVAQERVAHVRDRLGPDESGRASPAPSYESWSTGAAYQDLWSAIHRAEEALVAYDSLEELRAGVAAAKQKANESAALAKSLVPEFKRVDRLLTRAEKLLAKKQPSELRPARDSLQGLRLKINSYRDAKWDGIVNARATMISGARLTAWTAYALMLLALALQAPRDAVAAGGVFFVVGALAGLVAQVRADARRDQSVEDYGLGSARLYQTVLLSGLAGIAGVVLMPIAIAATGTLTDLPPVSLTDSFTIEAHPATLLLAAAFGLSPQRLLAKLAAFGEQYKSDIGANSAVGSSPAEIEVDKGSAD
jgi:hypothetical protein